MSNLTTEDGTTIHWGETGTPTRSADPAVLLVHGITETHQTWAPIIDRLAENHRVIWMDLRGHGESGKADRYDLEAMAGDVVAVSLAAGLERPHLVGHSLGGAVVSAVGSLFGVSSVTNVDQSLQLGEFKTQIQAIESLLKDANSFETVIEGLFDQLSGTMLSESEQHRLASLRQPDQGVVLGVWEMMFTMSAEDIAAVVEIALAGYAGVDVPYLSLFGVDPGPDYHPWISGHIANAQTSLWGSGEYGHYPHLIEPDRFVSVLGAFWNGEPSD